MKKHCKVYIYIVLILILLSGNSIYSQNILTNGDFESGGSGNGFLVNNTGYSLATILGTSVPGNYAFVTNTQSLNSSFISGDTIFMNLNWVTLPFLRFTNLFKK